MNMHTGCMHNSEMVRFLKNMMQRALLALRERIFGSHAGVIWDSRTCGLSSKRQKRTRDGLDLHELFCTEPSSVWILNCKKNLVYFFIIDIVRSESILNEHLGHSFVFFIYHGGDICLSSA